MIYVENLIAHKEKSIVSGSDVFVNKDCWMRNIQVILTSKIIKSGNNQLIFGNNDGNNFNIKIQGSKFLATNKDKGTVSITNVEYDTLIKIIEGQYYIIEIKAGYKSNGDLMTFFKGEVSYISQKIHSRHDVTTYITFASEMVANYSQKRLNYRLNSGINMYAALAYICDKNGISRSGLSQDLKNKFLTKVYTDYQSTTSIFDSLVENDGDLYLSTDSSDGSLINCTTINDKRVITIDPNTIIIKNGNPTVTSAGLAITLLPTFNFKPGDILKIDNSIIDTSISNAEAVSSTFNTNYLDTTNGLNRYGMYMIMEINYIFENLGPGFELQIKGRALSIIDNLKSDKE